jgi:hypothetical protein
MQEKREQRDCVSGDRNCQLAGRHYLTPKVHALLGKRPIARKDQHAKAKLRVVLERSDFSAFTLKADMSIPTTWQAGSQDSVAAVMSEQFP